MTLITATELSDLQEPPVIADVRFYLADHDQGRREYADGHIPGAQFVDLHTDLADTSIDGAGRHPLPSTASFGELLQRLGVTPDTQVVVYDSAGGAMAARMWWMLQSVGHQNVAVLDGGITAWTDAGLPLSTEVPEPVATVYPVPDTWSGTVTADFVETAGDDGVVVVDSRAPERYSGETEPMDPRAGHIPGAINRFHGDVLDNSGRFKSPNELRAQFGDLGTQPVVYCGSGVTACHNLLGMRVAGITDARLFPGSWSQWSADPSRPIATGDQP